MSEVCDSPPVPLVSAAIRIVFHQNILSDIR
jgi:hypothetical protein